MRPSNQARANEARRHQAQTGESYAAALAAVRRDRLRAADSLDADSGKAGDPPDFHDVPVPQELPELVRYHANRIVRYLGQAVDEGRWANDDFAEWQRSTLYKLTDGLEHLNLLIGTISAYLRDIGVPPSYLRRYLQVREDRHVQTFLTPRVEEHLAGLTQQPRPEGSVIWHSWAPTSQPNRAGPTQSDTTRWKCGSTPSAPVIRTIRKRSTICQPTFASACSPSYRTCTPRTL
ncbi:hypothetical protein [Streptomyces sp. NPDC003554]